MHLAKSVSPEIFWKGNEPGSVFCVLGGNAGQLLQAPYLPCAASIVLEASYTCEMGTQGLTQMSCYFPSGPR
jgi:hypothetical protein